MNRTWLLRGALLVGVVVACLCWSTRRFIRHAVAVTHSTAQFHPSPDDPRVFYEPGAEAAARVVAAAMPSAIANVERQQYGPFEIPIRVYVCATIAGLVSYGADSRAGGYTANHRVFLSPKAENTAERLPRVLTHELSHLHLAQHSAPWHSLPVWFVEGLAAEVSGGGGAEGVEPAELRRAIAEGRIFEPKTATSLWVREGATASGLREHLFYAEAGSFIAYMRALDHAHFAALIHGLESDEGLELAFERAYGTPIQPVWQRFIASAKQGEP